MDRVIVRMETIDGITNPILFFPDSPAKKGNIEYYAEGCHGECSLDYYASTRPVEAQDELTATKYLSSYVAYIRTLPGHATYGLNQIDELP